MSFKKELFRKLTATFLVMGLLAVMLYFSVILVTSSNVFDPTLKTILTVCTGLLCLAALYFFYCKIYETVMLIKSVKAKPNSKNDDSSSNARAAHSSSHQNAHINANEQIKGAFHEEEYEDEDELEEIYEAPKPVAPKQNNTKKPKATLGKK